MTDEAVIDDKGRVAIPKRIRNKLDLREGTRVKLELEEGRVVIRKPVDPAEFIDKMEGFIKEGSPIQKADPLKLKEIWERQ
ncbi:MAG: AbrB/MazE/SpoVT family DNA-binding domain-containing protein [Candidatus Atabeyarchaeum deiterrae]